MEELTSGEEYIEHDPMETIELVADDTFAEDEERVFALLSVDDLPLGEYAAIGSVACGSAVIVSIGVGVLISILRRSSA